MGGRRNVIPIPARRGCPVLTVEVATPPGTTAVTPTVKLTYTVSAPSFCTNATFAPSSLAAAPKAALAVEASAKTARISCFIGVKGIGVIFEKPLIVQSS
jgi:hypothetical protein